jgi:hypothetical protein
MATIPPVSSALDLASQLAIDVRDARAIQERARAAEEARATADQRNALRTIDDEVTLLDARRRAAMQEQVDSEREQAEAAAELAASVSYTRPPPGLSRRYEATDTTAAPGEATSSVSTAAFASPRVTGMPLGEWAAVAAYQLQVAAGTEANSSLRVRA